MGYYIQTAENHNKAVAIATLHNGTVLQAAPQTYADIPVGKALIVVIDNGLFEAAGFCYDEEEFKEFTNPCETRRRSYVVIDRAIAEKLSGYR